MRNLEGNRMLAMVLFILVLPGLAGSSLAEGEARKVGLQDCITLATNRAEREGLFDADLLAARANLMEVKSGFYPQLKVVPEVRYYFDGSDTEIYFRGDIGQRLLEIPQNLARRRLALEQIKSAEHKRDRGRCEEISSVMKLYVGSLRSAEELKISRQRLAAAEKSAAMWRQVQTDEPALKKQKEDAEKNLRVAKGLAAQTELLNKFLRGQLMSLCGIKMDEAVELKALPVYKAPEVTIDQCLAWALKNRSDLLSARKDAEMLKEAARLAKMDRWPKPRLMVGYGETGSQTDVTTQRESVFAAIGVEFNIWDAGEITAKVRGIEAKIKGAGFQLDMLEKRVSESVILAFSDWYKAAQLLLAESSNEKILEEYKRAELRYRNGEITEVEFFAAEALKLENDFEAVKKNLTCFEKEADLLEAIEAGTEQLLNGLKESPGARK